MDLAVVVLAAGEGRRLRPLTWLVPKPLCPVLDRTLLDHTLDRVAVLHSARSSEVVVNLHHGGAAIAAHLTDRGLLAGCIGGDGNVVAAADPTVLAGLPRPPFAPAGASGPVGGAPAGASGPVGGAPAGASRVLVSPESGGALGTAGAIGRLVPWLDGRGVLVLNGDTFTTLDLHPLLEGWDGEAHRVLVAGPDPFGPGSQVAGALVPWRAASRLLAEPSGLWEGCWSDALASGQLESVNGSSLFVDCGTPDRYLDANLAALDEIASTEGASWLGAGAEVTGTATGSVVGAGAVVHGEVVDSVVWPGAVVHPGERLRTSVRTTPASNGNPVTVAVR